MKERLYIPTRYIEEEKQNPVIFLAGPIQGAEDWHSKAIGILKRRNSHVIVASPRRKYLDGEFIYEEQVNWETTHLRRAASNGAILFWLAKEKNHDNSRSYAQTTRFELAEWKVYHERDGIKMAVGIEEGFSGARYIRHRLTQDCPNIPVFSTLRETCDAVLGLVSPQFLNK